MLGFCRFFVVFVHVCVGLQYVLWMRASMYTDCRVVVMYLGLQRGSFAGQNLVLSFVSNPV